MQMQKPNTDELRALIRRFSRTGNDLKMLCKQASDPEYWIGLNPENAISTASTGNWDSPSRVSEAELQEAIQSYRALGFLSLPGLLSASKVMRMHAVVEKLLAADWPPVFSFVYDDFWLLGQASQLKCLLTSILHPDYRLLTRIWTHYVRAAPGHGGWVPHLDHPDEAGHTTSVWIPISPATLRNGCMYIVKRSNQTDRLCRDFPGMSTFSKEQVNSLLKNARALPAEPGTVLCWDEKILHWGGQVEDFCEPRISIALEFTVPSFAPASKQEKLLNPLSGPPSFETRLQLICDAILSYRRFEPMVERFLPLAQELAQTSIEPA
jgi:Phytanoyl-CoA dioxygenase (PhyH)